MPWIHLSIDIDSHYTELAASIFELYGALSVTLQDAADEPLLEPAPGEQPLWQAIRVVALFPADFSYDRLLKTLQAELQAPDTRLTVEVLEDRDWSNTWRDSFQAMCFGRRLWVCPAGESPPDPGAVVISLDPGLAFGTGTHTTTALCLEWLDANPPPGKCVIDYGCGSGILAIGAHKLGAVSVQAVDIDPQALTAARENAVRNDITRDFDVMPPQALPATPVELVLANILANPLIELADDLSRRVRPGGRIVLTGILEEQAGEVMAAYQSMFGFADPLILDVWVLLDGTRH